MKTPESGTEVFATDTKLCDEMRQHTEAFPVDMRLIAIEPMQVATRRFLLGYTANQMFTNNYMPKAPTLCMMFDYMNGVTD